MSSVAFVAFGVQNGTVPYTTDPYTPGAAGNQIFFLGMTNSGGALTFTMSGSATTLTNEPVSSQANFTDGAGDSYSLWDNLSCSGTAAQTFTVSQPNGANFIQSYLLETSGAVAVKNATYTVTASPGAGAGAINGAGVTVASGDMLIVIAFNSGIFDNNPTLNGPAGSTAITQYGSTLSQYWVGTGASITPTFTVQGAGSNLTDTYIVVQWVASQTGNTPPPPQVSAFGPMPRQIYVMP